MKAPRGRARAAAANPIASEIESPVPDSPARFTLRWLAARLRALQGPLRGRRFCLAYSGGLDSSALLAALAQLRSREGFELRALHVDHGLHPQSAAWAGAANARARAWRVPCETIELRLKLARGESLEALARQARYQALSERLASDEALLTAHNQDDQLETMLLALLRGSGVRGLAAMRASTRFARTVLLRPLLPVTRAQLEQFARAHALDWSEDLPIWMSASIAIICAAGSCPRSWHAGPRRPARPAAVPRTWRRLKACSSVRPARARRRRWTAAHCASAYCGVCHGRNAPMCCAGGSVRAV